MPAWTGQVSSCLATLLHAAHSLLSEIHPHTLYFQNCGHISNPNQCQLKIEERWWCCMFLYLCLLENFCLFSLRCLFLFIFLPPCSLSHSHPIPHLQRLPGEMMIAALPSHPIIYQQFMRNKGSHSI